MERFDRRQALMLSGGVLASLAADGIAGPSAAKKAGKRWFYPKPGTIKYWHGEKTSYNLILPGDAFPIVSDFGSIYGPQGKRRRLGKHGGVDIAAPLGTPVISADSGVVDVSEWNKFAGHRVRILPLSKSTTGEKDPEVPAFLRELERESPYAGTEYWHLHERYVKRGDVVKRGAVIGALGNTGSSTTTPVEHLHFFAVSGGETDNPHFFWIGAPKNLRFESEGGSNTVRISLFRPNQPESTYATPPESLQRLTYPLPSVNDVEYFRKIMRGMKKVR